MTERKIGRRAILAGAGVMAAAVAVPVMAAKTKAAGAAAPKWDYQTDVLCVGSGSAACSSAVSALDAGRR